MWILVARDSYVLACLTIFAATMTPAVAARHHKMDEASEHRSETDVDSAEADEESAGRLRAFWMTMPYMGPDPNSRKTTPSSDSVRRTGPGTPWPKPVTRPQMPWPMQWFPRPTAQPRLEVEDKISTAGGYTTDAMDPDYYVSFYTRQQPTFSAPLYVPDAMKKELVSLGVKFWQNLLVHDFTKDNSSSPAVAKLVVAQRAIRDVQAIQEDLTKARVLRHETMVEFVKVAKQLEIDEISLIRRELASDSMDSVTRIEMHELAKTVREQDREIKEKEKKMHAAVEEAEVQLARADLLAHRAYRPLAPAGQLAVAQSAVQKVQLIQEQMTNAKVSLRREVTLMAAAMEEAEKAELRKSKELTAAQKRFAEHEKKAEELEAEFQEAEKKMPPAVAEAEVQLARANVLFFGASNWWSFL